MALADYVAEICRWWLLLALLVAAAGKSIRFRRFRQDLAVSFPELGAAGVPVALAVVAVEWLLAALLLAGGSAGHYGQIGAAVLFAVFTSVVAVAMGQDRTVVCSCFGGASHPMSGYDLLRNGLLVGVAAFGALSPPSGTVDLISSVILAGLALILFQLSNGLRDIVALLRIPA
ncbi:MAG: hypothetical protein AMXMBFR59_16600 [Rhodanobacteraceae bacterium]